MPSAQLEEHAIAAAVIAALSATCRVDASALGTSTQLLDLGIDSLTLVTALTLVEASLAIELGTDDVAELLGARDVAELVTAILRRGPAADKSSENAGIAS
jgi:acyl carrier protein